MGSPWWGQTSAALTGTPLRNSAPGLVTNALSFRCLFLRENHYTHCFEEPLFLFAMGLFDQVLMTLIDP